MVGADDCNIINVGEHRDHGELLLQFDKQAMETETEEEWPQWVPLANSSAAGGEENTSIGEERGFGAIRPTEEEREMWGVLVDSSSNVTSSERVEGILKINCLNDEVVITIRTGVQAFQRSKHILLSN
jgi:hypothetical protein